MNRNHKLVFKFKFKNRLKNIDREEILSEISKLQKEDTIIEVTRLCRTRLEGTITKPSYNKIGKKPNPRNSFALIKRVKLVQELESTKISIV
jgi:hypothetical protein